MRTISVLIACFRAQDWLGDCLDALFAQTLPPGWRMQILLGVDGCPDTLRLVSKARYPGVEIVHIKQNCGTYVTFNTLMLYAAGELICRFDADDVMKPDYLRRHIQAIGTGMDMTMTWSIYTDERLQPTSHVMAHEVYHPENGLCRRGSEGQFVIRREVWQRLGGFRAWRCGADTDFYKRARFAGFADGVIEEFLYLRRTHRESLTAHPDTNFKSAERQRVTELIEDLRRQYESGRCVLRVEPEVACEHARL
jgi:GT2 family glycosyltransferase